MPYVITAFLSGLLSLAGTITGRVLLALGLGFVEYQGLQTMLSTVMDRINGGVGSSFGSMPLMAAWAGFFQLDVHISLVASAIGVKVLLNGLGSNAVRRIVSK